MHENKSNLSPGMKGFFQWLAINQPGVHKRVIGKIAGNSSLAGLGITAPTAVTESTAPAAKSVADKVSDIVMALSQGYLTVSQMNAQKKVLDLQLARAKQGLPPMELDMQAYGLTGPQVSVGLSPDVKKIAIFGGLGLALVYLLPKFLRKGR